MDQLGWLFDQPPYDRLDPGGRALLQARTEVTYLPQSAFVGRAGDVLDSVWVVRRGAIRRHQPGPEVIVEEGETVGVTEAVEERPLATDLEVIDDLLAYLIPAATFRSLAADSPLRDALDQRGRADTAGPAITAATVAGPAHRIDSAATVAEAARTMDTVGVDALLVDDPIDPGREPIEARAPGSISIVTARDLRTRVLARDLGPETTVADVASPCPHILDPDTPLAEAMVFLLEHDIHHAPLADPDRCRLILSDDDILTHDGSAPFGLLRRSTADQADPGRFAENVTRTVASMVRRDIGPVAIGRAVSALVDGLTRSLCRRAEEALGPPPAPYAFCACGSQGRREQTLVTAQDNLLVHAGPDGAPWYDELVGRVVAGLMAAGIPAGPDGHTATNWNGSMRWWESTVGGWAADPGPESLLDLDIVADLRVVAGDLPAAGLWAPLHQAMAEPLLVRRVGAEVMRFRPPARFSGLFGRGSGLDVEKQGLIPIVGLGRLFGLELGLSDASTIDRLSAGAEGGLLAEDASDALTGGLEFLTGLGLRGRLQSMEATGDWRAAPLTRDDLTPVEQSILRETLRTVSEVQHATSARLGLDALA